VKDNTQLSKEFLSKAIANMPDDFSLADARMAMKKALTIIEMVENRRERRAANEQQANASEKWKQDMAIGQVASQWKVNPQTGNVSSQFEANMAKKMVQSLDSMLAAEKKKLQMLESKLKDKKTPAAPTKRQNNEDMGPIFG
jgi:hypothetical protein